MTIAISLPVLWLIAISFFMFVVATWLCFSQGLFDGSDTYGVWALFIVCIYAVFWAVPSLATWAVWATWFKEAL